MLNQAQFTPLRPSRVLAKLAAGQAASCVKLNLADPRVAEIAALAGFDCVWLDLEHVPNSLHDIENGVRAAKAHGVDTLVRVSRGSYSDLVRPLEMDAAGIMVPHVMSAAEAKAIAWQTKFHPIGRRALDGGNADGAYTAVNLAAYMSHANAERFVVVQIEDPEALAELDAIAATPGIDMLFFGPGDFSQGIGRPGDFEHPEVVAARVAVAAAARRHGKVAGTVASVASLPAMLDLGYRFVSVGADVAGLSAYFRQLSAAFPNAPRTGTAESLYSASATQPPRMS